MTWLHRFAHLVTAATFVLILAGGLVTASGAGLAIQDWPTTNGHSVLSFPWTGWVGPVAYQQAHRVIAVAVGVLALGLTAWVWLVDRRRWVRTAAIFGLTAVVLQALVGGMTVLLRLPAFVSTLHAGLANLVFCTTTLLAVVSSAGWLRGYRRGRPAGASPDSQPDPEVVSANAVASDRLLRRLAFATMIVVYAQVLLGAAMRHTGAALAIPDYPLAFGRLIPPAERVDADVVLHFLHRVWALVTTLTVLFTVARIWTVHPSRRELVRPSAALVALVIGEIALGGAAVLVGRNLPLEIALIAAGALILATAVVIALRSYRPLFNDDLGWQLQQTPIRGAVRVTPSSASALSPTSLATGPGLGR